MGRVWTAAAVVVWCMVVGLLWQLNWRVFAPRSVACVVRVIALVNRVSSIWQVWLAINVVGMFRSSTNKEISVCG